MQVLATWTPEDGILGAVAPLGLAAAQPTCLVVDLDETGPNYPGDLSLARLVAEGPTRSELEPNRSGVAVVANGGVSLDESQEVVEALCRSWPSVVLRLPPAGGEVSWPVVPVRPLVPGGLFQSRTVVGDAVYQRSAWPGTVPPGSIALPVPRSAALAALFSGALPRRSAWVRAWRAVWERPWV